MILKHLTLLYINLTGVWDLQECSKKANTRMVDYLNHRSHGVLLGADFHNVDGVIVTGHVLDLRVLVRRILKNTCTGNIQLGFRNNQPVEQIHIDMPTNLL